MQTPRSCIRCHSQFTSYPGKPGLIWECESCGRATATKRDPEPIGGNMIWLHKTAPRGNAARG